MPYGLTVVAVVAESTYDFKVLVEIDKSTLEHLSQIRQVTAPKAGSVIDITQILNRLQGLERRENDIKLFGQIVERLLPKHEDEE